MKYYRRNRRRWPLRAALLILAAAAIFCALKFALPGVKGINIFPTPAPTATTAEVALDPFSCYTIQFGAFDNDADARTLAQAYVARGAAGYVLTDTRSRALGAAYLTRQDANSVSDNLAAQGIDSYVYTITAPALRLRITAPPALINAVRSASAATVNAIGELLTISRQLDSGAFTVARAQTGLKTLSESLQSQYDNLISILENRTHAVTDAILDEIKAAIQALDALLQQNSDSAMAFSGKIKYNIIDMMLRHVQFMKKFIQPAT